VQVLERSLTRAGPAVRLGLQFGEAAGDSAPSAWAEGLKVGDILDCMDKGRRWRAARVAALSPAVEGGAPAGAKLTISFKGWSAKHDEEVPRTSKRLARPGTHTAGKDTRAVRRQGEAFDVDLEVLASLELRIDDYIAGEFPPEERVRCAAARHAGGQAAERAVPAVGPRQFGGWMHAAAARADGACGTEV
jgi:hypothetical protein